MREEVVHSRNVELHTSEVLQKEASIALGSSAPGDLPLPKCIQTVIHESPTKKDLSSQSCSPKSSPTLDKKPFPVIRGLLQGVKTLFSPQKESMKTHATLETKYFITPDALLQLTPESVKYFGREGFQFFYPIFCGELMIRVWTRPEGSLYALEIFGEDGEPVLGPKSPYWKQVENYDWSWKLRASKTQPIFELEEVKTIIDELYRAAPSSWK
eukprot:CAMPEP_0168552726 /NCGR_PEP_ID=MMETSP0413-20121227/6871_1 /TAXON_ID=136452 /ORGANISM="Filamoeba nolandi, Strain NC-AS-23-1" /LENGTH=212 /DNA_ID=CAMNT_0008583361 /DNA_START=21 /DNA_END=656 /DNA_ORIENTATION=-